MLVLPKLFMFATFRATENPRIMREELNFGRKVFAPDISLKSRYRFFRTLGEISKSMDHFWNSQSKKKRMFRPSVIQIFINSTQRSNASVRSLPPCLLPFFCNFCNFDAKICNGQNKLRERQINYRLIRSLADPFRIKNSAIVVRPTTAIKDLLAGLNRQPSAYRADALPLS